MKKHLYLEEYEEGEDLGGGAEPEEELTFEQEEEKLLEDTFGAEDEEDEAEEDQPNEEEETEETPDEEESDTNNLTEEPEGLTPNASERFQNLVAANKELTEVKTSYDDVKSFIHESVSSQEEFVQAMDYTRAIKEGRTDDAIAMIQEQAKQLSLMTGKPFQVDPLAPEDRQRVENFEIDEADALALAKSRYEQQQYQRGQTQEQQRQHEAQEYQGKLDTMAETITNMESQWKASDPDYEYKVNQIKANLPQLKAEFPDPAQWPAIMKMQYEGVHVPRTKKPLPMSNSTPSSKLEPEITTYEQLADKML